MTRATRGPSLALALALILAAGVYAPTLRAPFQFDDISFVRDNPALHALWPPARWIRAGHQETRPLVNLSFALNRAWSGGDPWSYHLVNLALHLACVGLLFVFVRRSLPLLVPPWPERADPVAAGAALLLAVHPVHSESVIYVQGRPGLLATAFGLAVLARAAAALPAWRQGHRRAADPASMAALTLLALLSKESAAVLPALVLLYDLTVVARWRWAEVRGRLAGFHLPQWAALLVLPVLFTTVSNPHRGVFGPGTVDAAAFYLTQPQVLLFYVGLYLWPARLSVDHGLPLASAQAPSTWLYAAAAAVLVAGAVAALRRAPWAGFCAAWWLAAIAPTSLVPNREFAAERYLTFATPAFAALAAWLVGAATRRATLALAISALAALPLGARTFVHGRVWLSGRALWKRAVDVSPRHWRAWYQYGWFLWHDADHAAALSAARTARALSPAAHEPHLLVSRILGDSGFPDSALVEAREGARLAPGVATAHVMVAQALMQLERWDEAQAACERALRRDGAQAAAFAYRAECRARLGDTARARADAATLEARRPDLGAGPFLYGLLASQAGDDAGAERWLSRALTREPRHVEALNLRAFTRFRMGMKREALGDYLRYFRLTGAARWDFTSLYYTALCRQSLGEDAAAASLLRRVTALRPELAQPWVELAYTLAAARDSAVRDRAAARAALAEGLRRAEAGDSAVAARARQVRAALGPGS